ncbi:hypothetical protein AM587_10006389 [Phytophthora nicotianae]|uniref:RxLR effector protein n=1 Tax=Phytophthora nicotianae TaxID=4792 RepID=A0A0W8CE57_PHYNI|nr:hypothetical protein AM587_10006389 [Phytophthora nicotianae]KUF82362.1 hypothetical protein AM588_10000365 [Phytophthora nicotianae]
MRLSYAIVAIAATFLATSEAFVDASHAGQRRLRTDHTTTADEEERTIPENIRRIIAAKVGIAADKVDDVAHIQRFFADNPGAQEKYIKLFNKQQAKHKKHGPPIFKVDNH